MRISSAPTLTSWSIVSAILDRSTIALTATHSGSSSGIIDGARRPGVTAVALESIARRTLYWHTIYLPAATTPAMRAVILSTRSACFDVEERISTASDWSTVAIGLRPAARIVSPDSVHALRRVVPTWRGVVLRTYKVDCEEKVSRWDGFTEGYTRTNGICEAESTRCFDAAADILDLRAGVAL